MEEQKQSNWNPNSNRESPIENTVRKKEYQNREANSPNADDQKNTDNQKGEEGQGEKGHNIVEKITFILGLLVLLVLFSFLIYQWSNKTSNPPDLVITTSHQPQMDHYGFKIEVENKGDETAEATNIKLSLYQEGEMAESGTVEFQYIPVKSKETAYIVFHSQRKPQDSLVVSSVTFTKP